MLTSAASANSQREFKRPANHMTQLHYETNHPVLTGRGPTAPPRPPPASLQETASTDGHSVRASVPNRPSTDATSVQNLFGCMVLNIELGSRNGRISRGKRAPTVVFRGEAEKGLEREGAVQASQFPQPDFSKYM